MPSIRNLWRCTFSPRLYKIYEVTWVGRLIDKSYEPKRLEKYCDYIVVSFATIWSISLYAIPLVVTFMYQRNYSLVENVYSLTKLVQGAGIILIASLAARGCSRANNPVYLKFVQTLNDAQAHYNTETKQELQKYDFEFWAWPIDFRVKEDPSREKLTLEKIASSSGRAKKYSGKEYVMALPCKLISYIVAHTFAIKMIYPGSVSLLQWAFHSTLLKGRIDLIKHGGERAKLVTCDNNEIDVMVIDRRKKSANGDILVVCCEGNCGFYENGIVPTPLDKGYSVLGWNHPGFGGSTGAPYPSQEENAIDCVMQYAIEHLKFSENQIILYGWSIGGYTATWAAMNYPSIKTLILDATFDDILPLALMAMQSSLKSIVRSVIRDHFNLNIAEQLNRYNGTVLLIRRTEDEVVRTSNSLADNCGNVLLTKMLIKRYPHLFSEILETATILGKFLAADVCGKESIWKATEVNEKHCLELIRIDKEQNNGVISYPSTLGKNLDINTKKKLILFLVTMYMKDQPSSHCTPLTIDLFQPGWDPSSIK